MINLRTMRSVAPRLLVTLMIGAVIAACGPGAASSPSSSAGPSPSAVPTAPTVDSPAAAAAVVIASDTRFAKLTPQNPNLIGQCCFYTATQTGAAYAVTIEIGWGDCPAGCISRHHWFYSVAADGTFHLDREDGPPVPAGVPDLGDGTTDGQIGIRGLATAGPVCPVVRPNDPACADRPVAGATVHVIDETGTEVATLETDATGAFRVTLPPGRYRLVSDPVQGLMGTAQPVDVTVGTTLAQVTLLYDTGIR
jgi:hypothetical protein